jgi:hypothetical protein
MPFFHPVAKNIFPDFVFFVELLSGLGFFRFFGRRALNGL